MKDKRLRNSRGGTRRGGRRKGAGAPNHWGEPLIQSSIRFPESMYVKLEKRALEKGQGLSYTVVELLKRIEKFITEK